MVQRSKRSMSAHKAKEMQEETKAFHSRVRVWCGEIPISHPIYIALDVLNFALHLANSRFNAELSNMKADTFDRLYRSDVDAGE
jgi:hypothetical protein